ncbi:hypothetical protein F6R98_10760 [Candidatus Methylospira mobilis]|uniref:Uncharacterized protein n=1 Tax=Candidatus Methylospira mobilis TaxID=1808979 RepID=A0A5Q0BLP3_9GAMM|nr:hypothetical protein [Candidatus Methylospira mobilis]QFY43038.1 hypothetical protein F6R98_10760 [Candidatus Methylospira mobilis]
MADSSAALQAVIDSVSAQAASASAGDLAYLAKALEAIGPASQTAFIAQLGGTQVNLINSASNSAQTAISSAEQAATQAISSAEQAATQAISSDQTVAVGAVTTAGANAIQAISTAQTTATTAVNTAGASQIAQIGSLGKFSVGIEPASGGTALVIPTIYTENDRNGFGWPFGAQWSSTGPWTTLFGYGTNGAPDAVQWMNIALGTGYANYSVPSHGASAFNRYTTGARREIEYAYGDEVCATREIIQFSGGNYAPAGIRLLPIRNTANTSKTITIGVHYSTMWSSGYEGAGLYLLSPPANTTYGNVTSVSVSVPWSITSNAAQSYTTVSATLPANATSILMLVTSAYTTSNVAWSANGQSAYVAKQCNGFYNLNNVFSDTALQPDMRMASVLAADRGHASMAYNSNTLHLIWQRTATLEGDR